MRHYAKLDSNHHAVKAYLELHGARVQSLASLGHGVPDLLVGYKGRNYLLEVKDGSLPPSRQYLTPDELEWHARWEGHVAVVNSPDVALAVVQKRVKP
jgi:hypothetical protein